MQTASGQVPVTALSDCDTALLQQRHMFSGFRSSVSQEQCISETGQLQIRTVIRKQQPQVL